MTPCMHAVRQQDTNSCIDNTIVLYNKLNNYIMHSVLYIVERGSKARRQAS